MRKNNNEFCIILPILIGLYDDKDLMNMEKP